MSEKATKRDLEELRQEFVEVKDKVDLIQRMIAKLIVALKNLEVDFHTEKRKHR